MSFDGDTFNEALDGERLSRQLDRVFALMKDGRWRTLAGIASQCQPATEASVSARLRDFRKKKFGGHLVENRRDETADGLWWYRLIPNENPEYDMTDGDDDGPQLPTALHEGEMEILGVKVRCSRLDDGRVVVHADDFHKLLDVLIPGKGVA